MLAFEIKHLYSYWSSLVSDPMQAIAIHPLKVSITARKKNNPKNPFFGVSLKNQSEMPHKYMELSNWAYKPLSVIVKRIAPAGMLYFSAR